MVTIFTEITTVLLGQGMYTKKILGVNVNILR